VNWLRGALMGLTMLLIVAFAMGFVAFARGVREAPAPTPAPQAEAIVALTGGTLARLETGVELLRAGRGGRLLISGVNPDVTDEELYALLDIEEELAACCVEFGRAAEDTLGNASEVSAWARRNGFRCIIAVTDDYHMPRSLVELRLALPEADIIAYPVKTRWTRGDRWRTDAHAARLIGGEYVKYLTIRAREALIALSARAEKENPTKAKNGA
jgi:uncharacterized SAM-binding protein YcdF (DUF218 family)